MSQTIRAVVFGNGFAQRVILPCLRQVGGVEAVGLASPNQEKAIETAKLFGLERIAPDHRELLRDLRPDLVFVTTPPHLHAVQAIDALEAGCHVVCEKPTALNARESAAMLEAARRHPDRLALLDHELRFLPTRQHLARLISEGHLGRILRVDYTLHSHLRRDPQKPWTWWSDESQGGGLLGAIGSHAIDALRWMLAEIEEVRGWTATVHPTRPDPETGEPREVTSDDFAAAWIRFRAGVLGSLTLSGVEAARTHRISVTGSEATAVLEEQGPLRILRTGESDFSEVEVVDRLPRSEDLQIPDTDWSRAFLVFAREIAGAIRDGRTQVDGASDFEDGHLNQLVLDAIRRSSEEGRWISPAGL